MVTGPTFFSANFDFGAQLSHENFKILHPHFSHVIYNLSKTLFCIKIDQKMAEISSKERLKNMRYLKKNYGFLTDAHWQILGFCRDKNL
jgi:hypothetical protein